MNCGITVVKLSDDGVTVSPTDDDPATESDTSSSSSCSSVETADAFYDMLGLATDGAPGGLLGLLNDDCSDAHEGGTRPNGAALIAPRRFDRPDRPRPAVAPLHLPPLCSRYRHPPSSCLAFAISDFLDPTECTSLVRHAATSAGTSAGAGFQYVKEATHRAPDGSTHSVRIHNPNPHKLSAFEHPPTVRALWDRLNPIVGPRVRRYAERTNRGKPLGLNPRLRVLRYDSEDGDRFDPHYDASTRVGDATSRLTVLIYLNDGDGVDFEGGETRYLNSSDSLGGGRDEWEEGEVVKVIPKAGTVVVFEHDLYHSGSPLVRGTKYVLRTDVLFEDSQDGDDGVPDPRCQEAQAEREAVCTVADICSGMGLDDDARATLEEMDMFHITVDAFLCPGVTMIRLMLRDVGLGTEMVEALIREAGKYSKMKG